MKWEEMFAGKCFISDLGDKHSEESGDESASLERYAAWAPLKGGKSHQIVEVGSDLKMLMEKYNVPLERVCVLAY
ncbi:MAG: hypothetical protein J1F18_03250 [Lachnospiraceae bacterium]|nr:hypothetical protein [Lachnospiraceae bacterium]